MNWLFHLDWQWWQGNGAKKCPRKKWNSSLKSLKRRNTTCRPGECLTIGRHLWVLICGTKRKFCVSKGREEIPTSSTCLEETATGREGLMSKRSPKRKGRKLREATISGCQLWKLADNLEQILYTLLKNQSLFSQHTRLIPVSHKDLCIFLTWSISVNSTCAHLENIGPNIKFTMTCSQPHLWVSQNLFTCVATWLTLHSTETHWKPIALLTCVNFCKTMK